MNGETSKAKARRIRENWFCRFAPEDRTGIDIGCGADPLNSTFRRWDMLLGDGDASLMEGVPDDTFHTVYASHVLEHLRDPVTAVQHWMRICRPGGHVIIAVPHRDLYERKLDLPSRWNADHKWFWLPATDESPVTLSLSRVIDSGCKCFRHQLVDLRVCDEGWQSVDPNAHAVGEYSIEAVIRKG